MRKSMIAEDDELMSEQETEPIWRLIRKLKVLGICTVAAGVGGAFLPQLFGADGTAWMLACALVGGATLTSGFSMDYALWRSARDRAIADALDLERVAAEKK